MPTDFCQQKGPTLIRHILIANTGLAAVKAISSIRQWCGSFYGNGRAITISLMVTMSNVEENVKSTPSDLLRQADHLISVPAGPASFNFANIRVILSAVKKSGADAVWVGWGYASENPALPEALASLEPPVQFIGPSASSMRLCGDKIASQNLAKSLNIPTIPWSGDFHQIIDAEEAGETSVNVASHGASATHNFMDHARESLPGLSDANHAVQVCEQLGYPVMLKASEGGGGKGIRKAHSSCQVNQFFEAVRLEVPGSPILAMRALDSCRHLEIQILADKYGTVIALEGGRDCSVQRRHQKIIEEAPISIAPASVIEAMAQDAKRIISAVDYAGVATVEYLFDVTSGEYYFLEINPRLQLEHPLSEMISGINIPAIMVQIAMGISLQDVPQIRSRYFSSLSPPAPHEFVVSARITAENPHRNFCPSSGTIEKIHFAPSAHCWGYFYNSNFEFSDSQFGHVFGRGFTRLEAISNLIHGLLSIRIDGTCTHSTPYLISLLQLKTFQSNSHSTTWIDELLLSQDIHRPTSDIKLITCVAVSRVMQHHLKDISNSNTPRFQVQTHFPISLIWRSIAYELHGFITSSSTVSIRLPAAQESITVLVRQIGTLEFLVNLDRTYVVYLKDTKSASVDGVWMDFEEPQHNSPFLTTPSSGILLRYLVEDQVVKGQPFAELEVMKMVLPLVSNLTGRIEKLVGAQSPVTAGQNLCTVNELDSITLVTTIEVYSGALPVFDWSIPKELISCPYRDWNIICAVLNGYHFMPLDGYLGLSSLTRQFFEHLVSHDEFYLRLFQDALAADSAFLSDDFHSDIDALLSSFPHNYIHTEGEGDTLSVIVGKIRTLLQNQSSEMNHRMKFLAPLLNLFQDGRISFVSHLVRNVMLHYLNIHASLAESQHQIGKMIHSFADPLFMPITGSASLWHRAAAKSSESSHLIMITILKFVMPNLVKMWTGDSIQDPKSPFALMARVANPSVRRAFQTLLFNWDSFGNFHDDVAYKGILFEEYCLKFNQDLKNAQVKLGTATRGNVQFYIAIVQYSKESNCLCFKSAIEVFDAFSCTSDWPRFVCLTSSTPLTNADELQKMAHDYFLPSCWALACKNGIFTIFAKCPNLPYFWTLDVCTGSWYLTSSIHDLVEKPDQIRLRNLRAKTATLGTSYVNDFIAMLKYLSGARWNGNEPLDAFRYQQLELSLTDGLAVLVPSTSPGRSTCGMIVWRVFYKSREYPNGREFILIANDITHYSGSFGLIEDRTFLEASKLARSEGIPRVYISCNAGAKLGLASQVMSKFRVKWKNQDKKYLGLEYLYLTKEDYASISSDSLHASWIPELGHYRILDVFGTEVGLNQENLSASASIAAETTLAYETIFTLTLVTGRSIGIGAYVSRLGQRIIQVANAPILLTGYTALNKLLGKEVYSSNLQLGGPEIMAANGISHIVVDNDWEGISSVLDWLSFIPASQGASCIPLEDVACTLSDFEPRLIGLDFSSLEGDVDQRILLTGSYDSSNNWRSGFLDRDSFMETCSSWAPGVVIGRGRLCALPVGIIIVQGCRTTSHFDQHENSSSSTVRNQAGNVFYADSSYKVAQAISDLKREELPLVIFADWRGFSGSRIDMSREVLKFGSMIVEQLRTFERPAVIYILRELRGGSWVVMDTQINPDHITMLAETNARGGILEPSAMVEIRFRESHLSALMRRDGLSDSMISNSEDYEAYKMAAVNFADLHDTPARMLKMGVIQGIVDWSTSRNYIHALLLRKLQKLF